MASTPSPMLPSWLIQTAASRKIEGPPPRMADEKIAAKIAPVTTESASWSSSAAAVSWTPRVVVGQRDCGGDAGTG